MIKILRRIVFFSQFIILPIWGQAQQIAKKPLIQPNVVLLQKMATDQNDKFIKNRDRALELAKKHKWVITDTQANGSTISLQGLTETGRPLYYVTYNNEISAITTNTNKVWTGGSAGFNLDGSSSFLSGKLGIWDGGAVRGTHQELRNRIVSRDGATALNDHATHVAGTMIAQGVYPAVKGMAHGALNLQAWNYNNDGSEIAAAANSLLVSNHSYGNLAGWRQVGTNWYWYGEMNVSDKEDVYFGYYSNTAQLWDNIAFNSPYYLMVKAAGNSRYMPEPAVGQAYYRYNPNIGNWELVASGRTADMRFHTAYDVIPDHSVAKNILTVGAISALSNGYNQPSDVVEYIASSWGPTDDGRIKPDLVGSGIRVTSSFATADDAYAYATGTSMATPNVSGSLILLQEHYANLNKGKFMLAATLKGLAIHTANEAGPAPGPDYKFGWGVLNTEQAVGVIANKLKKNDLSEKVLVQGQSYTQTVVASGSEPLRATISWTDPAGSVLPMVPSTLNNRTPRLVNDLDIRVSNGTNVATPWILDPNNPAGNATTGDNIRDNVEQVLIPNPVPGMAYTITVSHKGTLKNGAQAYAMIVSGLQGLQYCASGPTLEAGARIENVTLGKINNNTSGCSTYSDYTNLSTNVEAGQTIPLAVTLGTCDVQADKIVKVYADWNEDGDFDDAQETVATSVPFSGNGTFNTAIEVPENVQIGRNSRLRLVLVETNNGESISACGSYEKGETEDYSLNFITPVNDMGIVSISNPAGTNFVSNSEQGITVAIKNFGTASQTNIPVTVTVKAGNTVVGTLSGIYTGTIGTFEEKLFTLPGSFATEPSTTYTFTATTALNTDNIIKNNQFVTTLTTQSLTQGPVASASRCADDELVNLKGYGNGTIYWYDAPTAGQLVAIGNATTTAFQSSNKKYYAALNEFAATTATLQNTTLGSFANTTRDTVYFDAAAPFILERVSLNAGASGSLTISLYNTSNTLIGSSQIAVTPGAAQYYVNLTVPAAGTQYKLLISAFTGGATANQHNAAGTVTYPYTIPGLLKITKSSTGTSYLYNWKIKATGNPSTRTEVSLNGSISASISKVCGGTNSGTITFNSPGPITGWEKSEDGNNWTPLVHSSNLYHFNNLSVTTQYRVLFNDGTCTNITSNPITITVAPIPVAIITPSGSTKLCEGSSLTLIASSGNSYLWSTGETTQSIQVSSLGNYTVEVTNEQGCSATSPVISVVNCLTTWTGTTNSDWNNTTNWSNGVPDADMNVIVPANLTRYPVLNAGTVASKNITNQGTLTVNGGTIEIKENFTNIGTLNQTNEGLLTFAGTGNHKISGSTFLNLRVGGNGTKTLESDITVTGNLTVAEGIIATGNYKIILDANATLTETNDHYVVGQVQAVRSFKNATTQTFGNMGLSLTTTANPVPTIQVTRVTGNTPNSNIRSVKRYFDIQVTSGKTSGLNASMEFTYLPHELNGLIESNLALYRSTDNGLNWTVQTNSVADQTINNYKVSLSGISAFSTWTVADKDPNMVLPVTITSFNAVKKNNDVLITWETAMEKDASGMEIEVSSDAKQYRTLGLIPAKGINSNTQQQYEFTDTEKYKSGTRYYRLKQLDFDGTYSYYGPKAVKFDNLVTPSLLAYPNPATNGTFALVAQAANAEVMQLDIKNAAGQSVYSSQEQLNKGENHLNIHLPAGQKPGVYTVLARYNNTLHPLKLVVQ